MIGGCRRGDVESRVGNLRTAVGTAKQRATTPAARALRPNLAHHTERPTPRYGGRRMTRSQLVPARHGAVLRTLTRGARSIPIVDQQSRANTAVDSYWSHHTVNSTPFDSAQASADYLEWRFSVYPLYREFMDLWGNHDDEVVLDYGCGPGNDVTGFLLYTMPRR